ncbi:hypothetical protein [Aeromicrobium sp.]|uniref:hypothetical protein n=1 Tax=Aeromicrobium sp. TaxID=1871063 RepID=UPI0030BC8077
MTRAALVVLGAYVGTVGAIVHRHTWSVGGIQWPWGLLMAIAATYAMVLAADRFARVGGAWFGLGWAIALMAQQFSPGGSYLIGSDSLGWSFTAGCLGAIVLGVLRPPRLGP